MKRPSLAWDDVLEGEILPAVTLDVTYRHLIHHVGAGRDYMPGHHDPAYARAQGVEGIFANTLFHQSFVDRVMTDWAGPAAFIARRKVAMRGPIQAGDALVGEGKVVGLRRGVEGRGAVDLDITLRNQKGVCCVASGTLLLPLKAAAA